MTLFDDGCKTAWKTKNEKIIPVVVEIPKEQAETLSPEELEETLDKLDAERVKKVNEKAWSQFHYYGNGCFTHGMIIVGRRNLPPEERISGGYFWRD